MRLIAENLGGERGGQPVFSGIDFALGEGECLIVTGPNGAGKSTLIRTLMGELPAPLGPSRPTRDSGRRLMETALRMVVSS